MNKALGIIEIKGLASAIVVSDTMIKSASIKIVELENTKGLGYITIKILGSASSTKSALINGRKIALKSNAFISSKAILNPSKDLNLKFSCKNI